MGGCAHVQVSCAREQVSCARAGELAHVQVSCAHVQVSRPRAPPLRLLPTGGSPQSAPSPPAGGSGLQARRATSTGEAGTAQNLGSPVCFSSSQRMRFPPLSFR